MKKHLVLVGLISLFCVFQTSLIWLGFTQLNNSLANNGRWQSAKLNLEKGVYGAAEFFNLHQALAFNYLNLAAWHGYQQITTTLDQPFNEASFDFFLADNSYINFIFDLSKEQFYALRLSNYPGYDTALLRVKTSGEFADKTIISPQSIGGNSWHQAHLKYDDSAKLLLVEVDNREIAQLPISIANRYQLGFKGAYATNLVDNVSVKTAAGETIFTEDFGYQDSKSNLKILGIFISLLALNLLGYCLLSRKKTIKTLTRLFTILLINLSWLLVLGLVEIYFYFFFIAVYPNPNSTLNQFIPKLNFSNSTLENDWTEIEIQKIMKTVNTGEAANIIFLGSSQTWGAGAQTETDKFVSVVERLANNESELSSPEKPNFQFINAAIQGVDSEVLVNFYETKLFQLNPKLVLVDLSNNDSNPEIFRNNLTKLVNLNKLKNVPTVFILEPNSPEYKYLLPLHGIMREVAATENTRLLDLDSYLKSNQDSGFLWWDDVHLTNYGHQLMGEYIYEHTKDMIKE